MAAASTHSVCSRRSRCEHDLCTKVSSSQVSLLIAPRSFCKSNDLQSALTVLSGAWTYIYRCNIRREISQCITCPRCALQKTVEMCQTEDCDVVLRRRIFMKERVKQYFLQENWQYIVAPQTSFFLPVPVQSWFEDLYSWWLNKVVDTVLKCLFCRWSHCFFLIEFVWFEWLNLFEELWESAGCRACSAL